MEPPEDRNRCDAAALLSPPELWSILAQRRMGPERVVVQSVGLENAAQVRLAEHDQVIEAFAPDRADEPLDVAVLPG
jgi:hypothetical protein